jgi:hypothetical protein
VVAGIPAGWAPSVLNDNARSFYGWTAARTVDA